MRPAVQRRHAEAGFTLIEALIAVLILVFGLAAIANLFLVAGTSNTVAHRTTGTVAQATEVMERIKTIPFLNLGVGTGGTVGSLTADQGVAACREVNPGDNCVVDPNTGQATTFNLYRDIPNMGTIRTRWVITRPIPDTVHVTVQSDLMLNVGTVREGPDPRSSSVFSAWRTCTLTGCPNPGA
ncbi:MAG: prepilin-type N-terminal cleavage/methylation domain-containing protein [Acidobacteria bacterium]|nr:prepilin-type N-terminal cleavage/methylation domain-containing protein [Acidobacteriota bacterium]